MDEHRRQLIDGLVVGLPKLLELVLQLAHTLALAFQLRCDVGLLCLEARNEIVSGVWQLDGVLF